MMRGRYTPEQIVRGLREADRLLEEGTELAEVLRELGISEPTYHRWYAQYGGMRVDNAKRLQELERENMKLRRILADKELENVALKGVLAEKELENIVLREIAKGNFCL
jgi:putative transposase